MNYHTATSWNSGSTDYVSPAIAANCNHMVACNWNILCHQLLQQWKELTYSELEQTGHIRNNIASLITRKYGIAPEMAENYLLNFERTLPTLGISAPLSARS